MSDHPFLELLATADKVAAGGLVPERQAAVVESIRTHGAALVRGAVRLDHCDAFRARGELREVELRMYESLAALLRRDQSRRAIRADVDPLALAELLVAGWMLISLNWLARGWKSRGNLAERLRAATQTIFQGAER